MWKRRIDCRFIARPTHAPPALTPTPIDPRAHPHSPLARTHARTQRAHVGLGRWGDGAFCRRLIPPPLSFEGVVPFGKNSATPPPPGCDLWQPPPARVAALVRGSWWALVVRLDFSKNPERTKIIASITVGSCRRGVADTATGFATGSISFGSS